MLFLIAITNKVGAIHAPKYLCKGDGLIYYTETVPLPDTKLWTFEGGSISSSTKTDTTEPVFYNTIGTFKTYTVSTFTSSGQTDYDTFLIIVIDWPIPDFYFPKDTSYCQGSAFSIVLAVNPSNFPNVTYDWSTGEKTQSITVNSAQTITVKLSINAANKECHALNKSINVTVSPQPLVNLGPDQLMCQNQKIVLDAKGNVGDKYLWTPTGEVTKQINVSLPGIYSVEVTTKDNCKATDDVELIDSCPHLIFIPNAINPNGDFLNDTFNKVWNFTPKEYTFSIYNRWGELLFETKNMTQGWDCKVNGNRVQEGVYVYKISYLDTDKRWYESRGTFYVMR